MTDCAVNKWIEISTASVAEQGYFAIALSGGKTPLEFYRKLAAHSAGQACEGYGVFLDRSRSSVTLVQQAG
jgi:6-phosphogluconolactonase/glucosamine-6-phosphate isomerase/deaminase